MTAQVSQTDGPTFKRSFSKRWRVNYIRGAGPKGMADNLTVSTLRVVRHTDPEAFRELLRMMREAAQDE